MSTPSNLPYPESLRAISIHFPHAWAIVHGRKDGEYRSRLTRYRGMVLIHASGSQDSDDYLVDYNIPPQQIVRKAILGAVDLFDCVEDPWQPGYIYRLRNPIVFKKPIPAAGQQSPFWPASTPERDKAFRQAWQQVQRVLDPEVENSGLAAEVNELVSDIQALDQELNQEINALEKELKQTPA